jgi:hypothetical protein
MCCPQRHDEGLGKLEPQALVFETEQRGKAVPTTPESVKRCKKDRKADQCNFDRGCMDGKGKRGIKDEPVTV